MKRLIKKMVSLGVVAALVMGCWMVSYAQTPHKRIALTFDDGPHSSYTADILALLREYQIKATFFVIGQNADRHPELLCQEVKEGHEIGNHTYSHPKLKEQNAESFSIELEKAQTAIKRISGVDALLFRPPEGFCEGVISTVAKEKGYQMVLWSVDTEDWRGRSADAIEDSIMDHVKDGSIILCHDYVVGQSHTAEALRRVIPQLLEAGYEFVTVSDLVRKR